MPIGFYELLQVAPDAPADVVRVAYQEQVAQVVRKLRAAEARQQDVAAIEARRAALAEAWSVLSDPLRRRRYDRFRELSRGALPADPEELWSQAGPSMIDPAAAAALHVLRTLTDLKVGEPVSDPTPVESEVSGVRRVERHERAVERTDSRVELRPEPRVEPAAESRPVELRVEPRVAEPDPRPAAGEATVAVPNPSRGGPTPPPLTFPAPSNAPGPAKKPEARAPAASGLSIDRNVAAEDLARLLDQYGPTGAFLRAAREMRRTTLPQLSATTRISLRFLDALERDAYTDLPGATFVRGYLKMVVRSLEAIPPGPEVDEFVEGFMSRFFRARG